MPEDKDLIALRGSTEASIKTLDEEIIKLKKKISDKQPDDKKTPPAEGVKPGKVSEAYDQFVTDQEAFLKEKQDFEEQRKKSYLEPFSKEEREAYKDLSYQELALIVKDRKNRKEGLFLTEPPPEPDPNDKIAIGWGQTTQGYGWYNSKGEILSTDRKSPYGVTK